MNNEINKLFKPNKEILSHDQAFKLKVSFLEKNKIQLSWDISKGCYLYKNIFSFKDIYQDKVETSGFPNGEMKHGRVKERASQTALEVATPFFIFPSGPGQAGLQNNGGCL